MGKLLRSRFVKVLLAATLFGGFNNIAIAEYDSGSFLDELKWHGFLSQSLVLTDENDFLGSSSDGSFDYNSAGLNVSWKATNNLQFSMQGLYKRIGNGEPKGSRLDYAILDYRMIDKFEYGVGARVGRLKNPFGFFNETWDVAATRPSLLLPESIYVDYLQQVFHSSDSVGLYGHKEFAEGTFMFSTIYGEPLIDQGSVGAIVGTKTNGSFNNERIGISRLSYEHGSGMWRTSLSYVDLTADFSPGVGDSVLTPFGPQPLGRGEVHSKMLLLSVELNVDDWRLTTEIQRRDHAINDVYFVDFLEKSLSYYVQVDYRISPKTRIYIRNDRAYLSKDDKAGTAYEAINPQSRFARNAFALDTTVGLTYTPSFEWTIGLEYHAVDGTFWLPDVENPDLANQQKHWNMFLAQVAYRF